MQILKYKHDQAGSVTMPKGAVLLKVGMQNGEFCFWALVDETEEETVTFKSRLFGTGRDLVFTESMRYFDTIFEGPWVWHVFVGEIDNGH